MAATTPPPPQVTTVKIELSPGAEPIVIVTGGGNVANTRQITSGGVSGESPETRVISVFPPPVAVQPAASNPPQAIGSVDQFEA